MPLLSCATPRRWLASLALFVLPLISAAQTSTAWVMGSNSFGQLGVTAPVAPATPVVIDTNASAVAVGLGHTIYLKTDGSLWAVGANEHGQLGLGDTTDRSTPVQLTTGVIAVAAGRAHSLFLKTDGTLWAIGDNTYGQLGTGDNLERTTPVQIASDVATIAAGDDHTLLIKTDGSLWTVGRNTYGQLGDTSTTSRNAPVQIATDVLKIAGSAANTVFIKTDNSLWSCGLRGLSAQRTPVQIATSVAAVAAGAAHTLFIKTDATLWVTGDNSSGQLGNGSTVSLSTPIQIGSGYSAVAAGFVHSLFLTSTGVVQIVGNNSLRQLGGTSSTNLTTPAQLATSGTVIASRQYHSAYITSAGTLWSIGDNAAGQLTAAPSSQLSPVTLGTGIVATSSGVAHTLYLKTDGTLWSVGDNAYGQLGTGNTLGRVQPVQIAIGVAAVAAGSWHTLFLKTDGTLWAAGRNSDGQLGTGNTTQRTSPVQIATGVTSISAGARHSLFIKTNGELWGMGDNNSRQLNNTSSSLLTPSFVASGVSDCAAGGSFSLWIKNRTLYSAPPTTPFSPSGIVATEVRAAAAGDRHALFLKTDGSLWNAGLLTSSILNPRDGVVALGTPFAIANDVTTIAAGGLGLGAGEGFSLFVKTDGTLWAMGDNRFGQLGDGTRINRAAPVQIATHVTAINAGDLQSSFVQAPPVAPAITTQPQSQSIADAGHALLQVKATGGFLSYQWFAGTSGDTSHPVLGGNASEVLTLPLTQTTSYWVRITNEIGTVDSATATITPQTVPAGTLSVAGSRTLGEFDESLGLFAPRQPVALGQDIATIAASADHALILKTDATLWATGTNTYGQLGTSDTANRTAPAQIATSVSAIAVGLRHSLFLKIDGTLWTTGANTYGQLGTGSTTNVSTPVQVASSVTAIAAGAYHSLFLKTDGTLWGMGESAIGTTTSRVSPVQIATSVASIAAGTYHSLFLKTDGTLWGTGGNTLGQLGDGTLVDQPTPVLISSGVSAVASSSSANHSLFLKTDGSLWGMGVNSNGQLGVADTTNQASPVLIASRVIACAAGGSHSLYITDDHSLWSTGGNAYGQLGDGSATNRFSPQEIATHVERAVGNTNASLFVTQAGATYGMGLNGNGLLSLASLPNQTTFVTLANNVTAIASAPGKSYYLTSDGSLWSSSGLPGGGSSAPGIIATNVARLFPVHLLKPLGGSGELSALVDRLLFLRTDGSLWGVGSNSYGALGTGDTVNRTTPVHIADDVVDAGSLWRFCVFIKADGTLWKTGSIPFPPNNVPTAEDLVPTQLTDHAVALTTSYRHALILKTDGSLWGLGDDQNGQLNINTGTQGVDNTTQSAPVLLAEQVASCASSARHTLILKRNGTLWGCGNNSYGQLTAAVALRSALHQIATGVTSMAAGPETSFFIKTDGSLWATGNNDYKQLGNLLSVASTTSPVQVTTSVASVFPAATGENTFLIKTDGSLSGMGRNDRRQFGVPATFVNTIPIRSQAYAVSGSGLHTLVLHAPVGDTLPVFTAQPVATSVAFGEITTLSVGVSSSAVVTYQWYQGASGDTSRPVAGATDATLRLSAFAATSSYWVRVSNAAGSVNSNSVAVAIAGSGTAGFRAWAEAAGLRGSHLATTADADGDGRPNLLEFAFHTAPDQDDASVPFTVESLHDSGSDFLVLTHRRGKDADVGFTYEQSNDLTSWSDASLAPVVTNPDADGDGLVEEVSVALPLNPAESARFLRVKVTSP
jgi:alpha-tubulin suppressor-like RCC1 family protein